MSKEQNFPFGKRKSPVQILVVVVVAVVVVNSQYGAIANGVSARLGEALGRNQEQEEKSWF